MSTFNLLSFNLLSATAAVLVVILFNCCKYCLAASSVISTVSYAVPHQATHLFKFPQTVKRRLKTHLFK